MSTDKKPTCFVIMPISDQDGYEKDHFSVVYDFLLKPACEEAGFDVMRADDVKKSNYIVIDILKRILESDIVVCDLSSGNPNVLYELGIRQAFNKKVLLVKDSISNKIFDIDGFRRVDYNEALKANTVDANKKSITEALIETYESGNEEVNSLIKFLSIEPASVGEKIEISEQTELILDAINSLKSLIKNGSENSLLFNSGKEWDSDDWGQGSGSGSGSERVFKKDILGDFMEDKYVKPLTKQYTGISIKGNSNKRSEDKT